MILCEASTGWAADLHGLEAAFQELAVIVGDAAADVQDNLPQSCAERDFDKPGIGDMAGESERFGAGRILRTDTLEDLGTFAENPRHVRQRLDIVDDGRLAPEAALCRKGR